MRTIELKISSADSAERLAELVWRDGRVETRFVCEEMRTAVDRWLARGLREWVDTAGGRTTRITTPEDPLFLQRLADDLRQQFNFSIDLREQERAAVALGRVEKAQVLSLLIRGQGKPPTVSGPVVKMQLRRISTAFVVSRDKQGHFVVGARPEARSKASTLVLHS